jgi:hypothetical protein
MPPGLSLTAAQGAGIRRASGAFRRPAYGCRKADALNAGAERGAGADVESRRYGVYFRGVADFNAQAILRKSLGSAQLRLPHRGATATNPDPCNCSGSRAGGRRDRGAEAIIGRVLLLR